MASNNRSLKAAELPPYPIKFVGRTKLLSDLSTEIIQGLRLLTITGPPGYGKSSLVFVLGDKMEKQGFSVLYFALKDKTTVKSVAELILETLNKVISSDPVRQVQEFLKCDLETKTLLILDNSEDVQIKEDKEFFAFLNNIGMFSVKCNMCTIVTTTQAFGVRVDTLSFNALSIPLGPLDDDESIMLWKKYCDNSTELERKHTTVSEVCKECMGMPWLIMVAASKVNKGYEIDRMLQDLKSSGEPLLSEKDEITRKIKEYFSRLPKDLRASLVTLAVYPASFSADNALSMFPESSSIQSKLIELQDYSLLKFDQEGKTYRIDNIVKSAVSKLKLDDFIYREYNKGVVQFVKLYLEYIQQLHAQFIGPRNMEALQMYRDNKRNILHAFDLAIEYKIRNAVEVSTEVVNFLAKCMNIEEFRTIYEGLAGIVEGEPKPYSDCLTSLGFKFLCYYGKENGTEAQRILQVAWERQELAGTLLETEERAHCLSKLGLCKARAGDYEEGVHMIVKGILIRKRLLSREHGNIKEMLVSGGFCDLAMALSTIEIKASIKIWKDICLKTYTRILETHPFTATLLQYIGDAYHQLEQYQQACEYKQKALEMRKKLLTTNHQDTCRSQVSLAKTLDKLSQSDQALHVLQTTLHIQAKVKASPSDIAATEQLIAEIRNNNQVVDVQIALESFSIDALDPQN